MAAVLAAHQGFFVVNSFNLKQTQKEAAALY